MTKLTESDIEQPFMTNWLSMQNGLNMTKDVDNVMFTNSQMLL